MVVNSRRSHFDIIADLLHICVMRLGAKKTHLVYLGNLNFKVVDHYLTSMIEMKLLEKDVDRYVATQKGIKYLDIYGELRSLVY